MNWIIHFGFISIWVYPAHNEHDEVSLTWTQDRRYDYIVGISVLGNVKCPGIIVTMHTILSSANPLEGYWPKHSLIKIHTVHERYNESLTRNVAEIFVNQANRDEVWVGYDRNHSSIHDIVLLRMEEPIRLTKKRGPQYAVLPFVDSIYNASTPETGWIVAGFGYTDDEHVKNNTILEVSSLSGSTVDCDEWIPREWGLFICISDDEGLYAVPSGGPLFHEDNHTIVLGIGCFHLKKGNEGILVFTRLKSYRFGLEGYFANDIETTSTTSTTTTTTSTQTSNQDEY